MLLSTVSVLVVAKSSSEIPEGLMNNPVHHSGRRVVLIMMFLLLVLNFLTSYGVSSVSCTRAPLAVTFLALKVVCRCYLLHAGNSCVFVVASLFVLGLISLFLCLAVCILTAFLSVVGFRWC